MEVEKEGMEVEEEIGWIFWMQTHFQPWASPI